MTALFVGTICSPEHDLEQNRIPIFGSCFVLRLAIAAVICDPFASCANPENSARARRFGGQ
ncbi:hypothetical protein NKJ90_00570 [Mesorhizobium sp. M0051]|uniref:hypothetical protein n=1 Tax=unclassified Mesorhizobium TaxID=325217 RepID=UPI00040A79D7|nr:hypothetical protein [Mesorhizobium sp. LNHC252B00]